MLRPCHPFPELAGEHLQRFSIQAQLVQPGVGESDVHAGFRLARPGRAIAHVELAQPPLGGRSVLNAEQHEIRALQASVAPNDDALDVRLALAVRHILFHRMLLSRRAINPGVGS